ncbi:hypothetical protein, partial [Latilactobacillus graminis]
MNKRFVGIISALLLTSQLVVGITPALAIDSSDDKQIQSFPTGNFQGDFTIDPQNKNVDAGQDVNFNINLKATGAVTKLTNVTLKITLPLSAYVTFTQPLESLKINGIAPTFDQTTNTLVYQFSQLPTGSVAKVKLRLGTVNGAFTNNQQLQVKGQLAADSDKGKVTTITDGAVNILATKNLSLINKFKSIYKSASDDTHDNPAIGDEILWNVGIGAPKKIEGSVFLKPGTPIKATYDIDPTLSYTSMADKSAPQPTISNDGKTLTWSFTAPSISEQEKNQDFFNQDLSLILKVKDDPKNVFKQAKNTLRDVSATFNDGELFSPAAVDGQITISQSDPTTLPPNVGSGGFTSPHFGPVDAYGALGDTSQFPDISVNDDATLGFGVQPGSLWATSGDSDFIAYTIHYKVDPHLNIKRFYTGNFAFHPSNKLGGSNIPLKNQPHYSFNVRYAEDDDDTPTTDPDSDGKVTNPDTNETVKYEAAHRDNWHTLMADVPLGKWLTAKDLNIPAGKHVKEVMLHFHPAKGTEMKRSWDGKTYTATGDENGLPKYYEADVSGGTGANYADDNDLSYLDNWAPAGMSNTDRLKFQMTPDKGYVGHVQNSMYINFRGSTAAGYATWQGSEYDWNHKYSAWSKVSGPQGANIVKPVEGINRVVKTGVQFDQLTTRSDGSKVVEVGPNTVTTNVENTETSKNDITGTTTSYVLLPKGVQYSTDQLENETTSSLVTANYKGTGQSLVKVTYDANYVKPGNRVTSTFKVEVTDSMSTAPELKVYSFLDTDNFSVPE